MSESAVQRAIVKHAKAQGWWTLKLNLFGMRGIPDLLCLRDGDYRWIEVKRPGAAARPLQKKIHTIMRRYGAVIAVIDNLEDAQEFLS